MDAPLTDLRMESIYQQVVNYCLSATLNSGYRLKTYRHDEFYLIFSLLTKCYFHVTYVSFAFFACNHNDLTMFVSY